MRTNFWLLQAPARQPRAVEAADTEYERIICPENAGHGPRGGKRIGDLSIVVHPSGVRDFTWIWGGDILVSQKVLEVFRKHHVTGYEAQHAKVSYPKAVKARPPDLFELIVTGWCRFAAPAAGVTLVMSCPACGHKRYAIAEPSRLIDPAAWDGSDLFIVWPLPGFRFASDRLAGIIRQERLSGVDLIPAPEIPIEKGASLTPGSLASHMPDKRARELCERFGI